MRKIFLDFLTIVGVLLFVTMVTAAPFSHGEVVDQVSSIVVPAEGQADLLEAQTSIDVPANMTMPDTELRIPLVFTYPYSGSQLRRGDTIQVAVAQNVYYGDTLLFKKGTEAYLDIKSAKGNRVYGRGGKIQIESGEVTDAFGRVHTLNLTSRTKGGSMLGPKIMPVLAYFYPPMALFSFYGLRKGDDAMIPAGKVLFATLSAPDNNTNVSLVKK
jgi:hypothetical protein